MSSQSHAQKRKAKLKKREEKKSRVSRPEPYFGRYWREKPECSHLLFRTEQAIILSWQISLLGDGFGLCDDDAVEAVETLILQLRAGRLAIPVSGDGSDPLPVDSDSPAELIFRMILREWQEHSSRHNLPGRDDMVGVLRTVLGSISNVRVDRPGSTRYLQFVSDWMKNELGIMTQAVRSDDHETLRAMGLAAPGAEEAGEGDVS
ncbi:MAG: hypothetical protein ACKOEO_18785 [Planctomycetaceae bacterium]